MAQTKAQHEHDEDHEVIWLAPVCQGGDRSWCQDDVWESHCDCIDGTHRPVKYVRDDRSPTHDAYEAACKALAHWRKEAQRLGRLAGVTPREMKR